jgi:OHCU decarboxylase
MTLAELNALDHARFGAVLRSVFEHSPWIAAEAFPLRPFTSFDALYSALMEIVRGASSEAQLGLLRAQPELVSRAAIRGEMTAESKRELERAGLIQCSPAEFARLHALNRAYDAKFGFPFIIAVNGLTPAQIIVRCEERLERDRPTEFAEALDEVGRITRLRLQVLLRAQPPEGNPGRA